MQNHFAPCCKRCWVNMTLIQGRCSLEKIWFASNFDQQRFTKATNKSEFKKSTFRRHSNAILKIINTSDNSFKRVPSLE